MRALRVVERVIANVAIVAFSTAVLLLLLEGAARQLGLSVPFFLYPGAGNCLQRSPLLSLEFQPNCAGHFARTVLRTNAIGLRGPNVRDHGARRILAIGDSCTWGWRVAEHESYPAVLQELLDRRAGAGHYEVINAGFPGYTSYQGLRYLRERGLRLRPSLVIAAFGFNDITRGGDVATLIALQARFMPLLRLDDVLLDRSRLYRWTRWKLSLSAPPARAKEPRVTATAFAVYMTQINDLARAAGARAMFVDFLGANNPYRQYRNVVLELERNAGAPLITYDGPRMDLVHPTVEGYRTLGATIAERVLQIELAKNNA